MNVIRCVAAGAALLLAGCTTKAASMSTEQQRDILPAFEEGRTTLDCHLACSWQWITRRRDLAVLYAGQRWDTLAIGVSEIGYQEDLGYFWLGEAAAAEGRLPAAARYYSAAYALSSVGAPNAQCRGNQSGGCFGVDVPRVASARLAQVNAMLLAAYRPQAAPAPLVERTPQAVAAPSVRPPAPDRARDEEIELPPIRP